MQLDPATIALLTQIYQGFNVRDTEAVLARMQPDVQWPKAFLNGYVRAYLAKQWASISPQVKPTGYERLPDGHVDVTESGRQITHGQHSTPLIGPARRPDCADEPSTKLM